MDPVFAPPARVLNSFTNIHSANIYKDLLITVKHSARWPWGCSLIPRCLPPSWRQAHNSKLRVWGKQEYTQILWEPEGRNCLLVGPGMANPGKPVHSHHQGTPGSMMPECVEWDPCLTSLGRDPLFNLRPMSNSLLQDPYKAFFQKGCCPQ